MGVTNLSAYIRLKAVYETVLHKKDITEINIKIQLLTFLSPFIRNYKTIEFMLRNHTART